MLESSHAVHSAVTCRGKQLLTYRAGAGAAFAVVIAAVPVGLAPAGMAQTAPRVKASPVAACLDGH